MGQANSGQLTLQMDEATVAWLSAALPVTDFVVLAVADGFGPFTQDEFCRPGCQYELLAVSAARLQSTPYAPLLSTPLGPWFIRPDTREWFNQHPQLVAQDAKLRLLDDTGLLARDLVLRVLAD